MLVKLKSGFYLVTESTTMKKLLSAYCSVLCFQSISQPPIETGSNSQKASGEKVLMKAIAVFVNPESNKKAPVKTVTIFSVESPR